MFDQIIYLFKTIKSWYQTSIVNMILQVFLYVYFISAEFIEGLPIGFFFANTFHFVFKELDCIARVDFLTKKLDMATQPSFLFFVIRFLMF